MTGEMVECGAYRLVAEAPFMETGTETAALFGAGAWLCGLSPTCPFPPLPHTLVPGY